MYIYSMNTTSMIILMGIAVMIVAQNTYGGGGDTVRQELHTRKLRTRAVYNSRRYRFIIYCS